MRLIDWFKNQKPMKIVNFINRAYEHLIKMYHKLKTKFAVVSIYYKVKNGLLFGHFKLQHPW